MVAKDPERQLIGRIGANTRWAHEENRTAATQPARDGFEKRFENEVDPDRVLTPQERAKRAASAKRAYFQRMALKSAQARRAKKSA